MLEWYEDENSKEPKNAPIILIPVELERLAGKDKFKLKYTEDEVSLNISFQAKLKSEFGIELPLLPDLEDLNIDSYFTKISKSIKHKENWKLSPNSIELGFFSFGKFLIYNDLDDSNWPKGKKPFMNPLLQGLLGEGGFGPNPDFGTDEFIDKNPITESLFQVVDADSSQIQAMLSIQNGNNQIIQGPPGTGKSQTITNIIANAIGQGKKVLFVAEKMAALEVVKRRLDKLNLGEACLELHSNKANKKNFLAELKRVVELGKPILSHLENEVYSLKKNRDSLNNYSELVNSIMPNCDLTFNQTIGKLLQINELFKDEIIPLISPEKIKNWGPEKFKEAEDFSDRIQKKLSEIGNPAKLIFWGSEIIVITPNEEIDAKASLADSLKNLNSLIALTEKTSNLLGLNMKSNMADSVSLIDHLTLSINKPDLETIDIGNPIWVKEKEKINRLLEIGKRIDELNLKYELIFITEIKTIDWAESRLIIALNENKWYKFLIRNFNNHKNKLLSYRKENKTSLKQNYLQIIDEIIEIQRLEKEFSSYYILGEKTFGKYWVTGFFKWNLMSEVAHFLEKFNQEIKSGKIDPLFAKSLTKNHEIEELKELKNNLGDCIEFSKKSTSKLFKILHFKESFIFPGNTIWTENYANLNSLMNSWFDKFQELQKTISWNIICSISIEEDLEEITKVAIGWENASLLLKAAIQKTWLDCIFERAIHANPTLAKFDRIIHEEMAKQFVKADQINFQLNMAKVALKHFENLPKLSAGGQMNVLRTEFNKKARHFPIRKLITEAGFAIQSIKPVFMMSPLSISNFLPPGVLEFDLVVFDEASQVRPVEAFGAIIRGKQLVVVGDSKQLPPTNFFDSISNDDIDEDNITSDMESIISLCDSNGIGVPQKMLRWHYRSKHESLIKYSNHAFYENKLVVFPSPETSDSYGLILHHHPETVYDRGLTRTNEEEARKVVERMINHIQNNPELTQGVVAFSTAQRQAIEDELEIQRNIYGEIEKFEQSHYTEPLFIKNLENVQGDERDVILISIGYGKTKEGFVSMSFGPLNNSGGEKRLNVLITRAKLRCEVFTNLTSDDIKIENTKSQGLIAFKDFLYFAQNGRLNLTTETGKQPDSYFEEQVANNLRNLGYDVRNQVGSNGFFIDLAIVDNKYPGRYLIGIECDGRMYHSARSARDRDRLRQQVLEGMGWKIHRIWSTDWFNNQDFELKRLI